MTGDTTNICFACSRSRSCMESLVTCTNIFVRVLTFLSRTRMPQIAGPEPPCHNCCWNCCLELALYTPY